MAQCVPVPSGLLSWWAAEDDGSDSQGLHSGTAQGGVIFVPGKVGQAFSFNGTSAYVDLGNWFNLQTFTIGMWVKPGAAQGFHSDIIDNNHTNDRSWAVQYDPLHFGAAQGGVAEAAFSLSDETWQYLAIARDTSREVRIYVDGVLISSAPGADPILYDGTEFLRLSRWGGGDRYWRGLMDEVQVYDRALTLDEIQMIYAAGSAGICRAPSSPQCAGDCNGDDEVTVDELVAMVNISLGVAPLDVCTNGDADGDGTVTVDEIILSVVRALSGTAPDRRGECAPASSSLVGTWVLGDPNHTEQPLVVVVFVDASHYMLIEDGDNDGGDGGYDGFEQGTYSWNPTTSEIHAQVQVDNNGEWGFSHSRPATIHLDGDELTYAETAGETFVFRRLEEQPANPLVGSWAAGPDDGRPDRVVFTFLDNSHYMFAQQGGGGPGGYDGIERGTYTWNQVTGLFTAAQAVDTNGELGFSNSEKSNAIRVMGTTLDFIEDGVLLGTATRVPYR